MLSGSPLTRCKVQCEQTLPPFDICQSRMWQVNFSISGEGRTIRKECWGANSTRVPSMSLASSIPLSKPFKLWLCHWWKMRRILPIFSWPQTANKVMGMEEFVKGYTHCKGALAIVLTIFALFVKEWVVPTPVVHWVRLGFEMTSLLCSLYWSRNNPWWKVLDFSVFEKLPLLVLQK